MAAPPLASGNTTTANVDTGDRLTFTLFLALAVHALLILGITFGDDLFSKPAPTLEITLATHSDTREPEKADFLAQHNQQASGTADKAKQMTTDQPSVFNDSTVRELNPQPMVKKSDPIPPSEQTQVTTVSKSQFKVQQSPETISEPQERKEGRDAADSSLSSEIASLRAKLDKQRQAIAKRPRVRRLTSVATKASVDAEYMNKWINRVVFVGNRNFPQEALARKIFGSLRLATTLKPNGTIHSVEILHSSGFAVLDNAALQIVHLASPFPPFPPEIRKDTDQLEIIRTWNFEISGLSTN